MTSVQHIQYQYASPHGLGVSNYNNSNNNNSSMAGSSPASTPPPPSLSIPIVSMRSSHQLSASPNAVVYCSSPLSSGPQTPVGLRGVEDTFAGGLCAQEPFVWLPPQSQQMMNVSANPTHLTFSTPTPSLQVSPVPSPNTSYYYAENSPSAFVFPPSQQQYVYAPIPPQFAMAMQPSSPNNGYAIYQHQHQQQQQLSARLYVDNQSNHSGSAQSSPIKGAKSKLPTCYLTESGEIGINIGMVVDRELIEQFACDKTGCHFLQAQYPTCKASTRQKIFERVVLNDDVFTMLVRDVFGNFLIQKMLEVGNAKELNDLAGRLSNNKYGQDRLYALCQDRYSCRVVQKAIECLPDGLRAPMIVSLYGREIALTLDQNGNHVIQRILHHFSPNKFKFVIDAYVADKETLRKVVENKYGCRVVQVALEELCAAPDGKHELKKLLSALLNDCDRFVSNEFANYVMQHIIVTDSLNDEREYIIEQCIRGNVLDMSQDKFASHVVEKAFKHASRICVGGQSSTLDMLMMEVFNGYLRDQQGREALDVMMFDQFGNYVVQTMLAVAAEMRHDKHRATWFEQLASRVAHNQSRLVKYSSGKKIIEQLKCIMGPNKSFGSVEDAIDENQNTPTYASKYERPQYGGSIPLPCAYRGY